jgi:hypothetical protein
MSFAAEKIALGNCDRCGWQYELKLLKYLIIRMKRTNLRVCPECWEADHPQYKQGLFPVYDPQALQNPRPDTGVEMARGRFGWSPLWVPSISLILGKIGVS